MKHALITGGTSGIGAASASALAAIGYTVTATGLTAREVEAAVPVAGVSFRQLDVTDDGAVHRLVGDLPHIDALVNAAGMILRAGKEYQIEGFRQTLEVNLVGTMRLCLACLPKLKATRGGIVNIASIMSFSGAPLTPGYAASKGGVAQLTKSLAAAWAGDGVRVNAVAPGFIATGFTQPLQQDEARSAGIVARTPMGRWGKPEDIGVAIRYLLSPDAGFVTGVILPVDGGYLAV